MHKVKGTRNSMVCSRDMKDLAGMQDMASHEAGVWTMKGVKG